MKHFFHQNFTNSPVNRSKKQSELNSINNINDLCKYIEKNKLKIYMDKYIGNIKFFVIVDEIENTIESTLKNFSLNRQEIYLTNIHENKDVLLKKISLIKPKKIILMGNKVVQKLLNRTEPISELKDEIFFIDKIPTLCLYSPAFIANFSFNLVEKNFKNFIL